MDKLIIGYYGYKNFGDDAMLCCLDYYIDGINHVLSETDELPKLNSQIHVRRKKYLYEFIGLTRKVKMIIWGGGTCFYGTWRNQLFLTLIVLIARLLGRRFIFYGVGVDAFDSQISEFLARLTIRICTSVYVRDYSSFIYIKSLNRNATLVNDPFLALSVERINKSAETIILNLSFRYINKDELEELIRKLKDNFKTIVAVTLCGSDLNENEFIDYLEQFHLDVVTRRYSNFEETINLFQCAQSYIGYRLHGMICSILTGTGFITYNYQDKIRKAGQELNINTSRIINDFSNIDIELLKQPERIECYKTMHLRTVDEIKSLH